MVSENELNIFEFNKMLNDAKHVYSKTEKKFFVDVKKLGGLILFHMTTFNCAECNTKYDEICENANMSLILDIVETKLNEKLIIKSKRIIESGCETDYYFVFVTQ
jgi:hypothetical protein